MPSKAWFLPIGCFPLIVKLSAVTRSFPGGLQAFDSAYSPIRKREAHVMVMAFTAPEAEAKMAELERFGIMRGIDVAAADDRGMPWIACTGVAFRRHRGSEYLRWVVEECDEQCAVVEEPLPPAWIALVCPRGFRQYSLQTDYVGIVIAIRDVAGDAAQREYLCAFLSEWGFIVRLNAYSRDQRFELARPNANVEISDHSEIMVKAALAACDWPEDDWPGVQYSLQRLAELKHRDVSVVDHQAAWCRPMSAG